MSVLNKISHHKIIAILRGAHPLDVLKIAEALYNGGIRILEVTMNSAEPLNVIRSLSTRFSSDMLIGAGTVLSTEAVEQVVEAGASFVLSPIANEDIIKASKKLGVLSIPGAFTPTEIYNAYKNGADVVKVFPANSPSYIKDISAPLPGIKLLPTGGITLDNIVNYKKAGAFGFGLGSSLVDTKREVNQTYLSEITNTAKKFVDAIAD